MSKFEVQVPPATPPAAPAPTPAATATPPATTGPQAPPAAPAATATPPATTGPQAPPAAPAAPTQAATGELPPVPAGVDTWLNPRLARAEAKGASKALKDAGFESEADAKAAAKALHDQRESEKHTAQKLAESQALFAQLRGRADAVTALLNEQATEAFATLTESQKAAVRLQAADDAPAEDRIKAIKVVRAVTASMSAPADTATPLAAPATPAQAPTAATPPLPAGDTSPGRTAPQGGEGSPANHKAVYETMRQKNPFAAARYGVEHAGDVFKPSA